LMLLYTEPKVMEIIGMFGLQSDNPQCPPDDTVTLR